MTQLDPLGRAAFVVAEHERGTYEPKSSRDVQGRVTSVTDARSIVVVAEHTFDGLGAKLKNVSVDAGTTKALGDVMGRPIRAWSARGYMSRVTYDVNGRPTRRYVTPPGGVIFCD